MKFYLKHKIKFASIVMKSLIDYSLLLVVVDQPNDIYDVVPLRLQILHYSPYPTITPKSNTITWPIVTVNEKILKFFL